MPPSMRIVPLAQWPHTEINEAARLYEVGRQTGYTVGHYHSLKTALIQSYVKNGKECIEPTIEHTVLGDFSQEGDSGSLIYNDDLEVVGLLFAGNERSQLTYFTHIEDVFHDIKAMTGTVDVRVK
ncbi:uncharacterized protein BO80DRAFT_442977 [Aspergillus ibericus CBS 121593]|uniref:Peptidase S1 domain-containing protein n=1 Tax=Aspergillus ibericus CBS 121593 TaxID=1448316 RepID=A0A395H5Y5_9EURO|nr:hypothetical protein BO80DRAFT_442977 [Aspergillus ibericus CBS 121593]RAL03301.1 hypothetical protein BO80DRAFT_442977 [Aspergillus ibericus CBS 121593]